MARHGRGYAGTVRFGMGLKETDQVAHRIWRASCAFRRRGRREQLGTRLRPRLSHLAGEAFCLLGVKGCTSETLDRLRNCTATQTT